MKFASVLFALFASGVALAAPATRTKCSAGSKTMVVPASVSGTPLAAPVGNPHFVALAAGVQNYTCGAAGTYTSAGALAELFDLSCIPQSEFNPLTTLVYDAWLHAPKNLEISTIIKTLNVFSPPTGLGQHYFIANPSGAAGLVPKWDFTSASLKGHPNAFVIGAKTGDIPAPTKPTVNVDWLSLRNSTGDLATQIFRMQTNGGQPPTSCTPGTADISVRYTSQYWFFGGSF